jgi:negative regulator of replication initiation
MGHQELVKMIKVKDDTYARLTRRFRKYGQTMDDIVRELLDIVEAKRK